MCSLNHKELASQGKNFNFTYYIRLLFIVVGCFEDLCCPKACSIMAIVVLLRL